VHWMRLTEFHGIWSEDKEEPTKEIRTSGKRVIPSQYSQTLAMTAISSVHPDRSPRGWWWRCALTSSSRATSDITLLAASWASCLAAVVLTEVVEPVSSKRRSRSNLENGASQENGRKERSCLCRPTLKTLRKKKGNRTGPVSRAVARKY